MTTQHAPKSIGSALFGITLVIFLRDVAEVRYSLSISLLLVRRMDGVPLRFDAVRHPAFKQD